MRFLPSVSKGKLSLTAWWHDVRTSPETRNVGMAGRTEPARTGAPREGIAKNLSPAGADARLEPPLHTADAAPGDRRLLAGAPAARRAACARAGSQERRSRGLDLAPWR